MARSSTGGGTLGVLWQALSKKAVTTSNARTGRHNTGIKSGLIKIIGLCFGQIQIGRFNNIKFHKNRVIITDSAVFT